MATTKKTFQRIPERFLTDQVSPKAVYLYAKISMLENKEYCQTAMGTHPNGKKEMTRQTVEKMTTELVNSNYITDVFDYVDGYKFKMHTYYLKDYEGYFKGVYNDFINLDTVSASEKGFAIMLSLLKEIPSSFREMERLTGVSANSCKSYFEALVNAGVIVGGKLNNIYFPDFIDPTSIARRKYEESLKETKEMFTNNQRITNQLLDLEKKVSKKPVNEITYNWGRKQINLIVAGIYGLKKEDEEYIMDRIIL